jgi:hypothetical protein
MMDALVATKISLDQLELAFEVRQIASLARGEVVEHTHLVPVGEQPLDQVGADEASSACD